MINGFSKKERDMAGLSGADNRERDRKNQTCPCNIE